MDIIREQDMRSCEGEHDFWFASQAQAGMAIDVLNAAGFTAGGAIGSFRASVALDSPVGKKNIDEARAIIMAAPNV